MAISTGSVLAVHLGAVRLRLCRRLVLALDLGAFHAEVLALRRCRVGLRPQSLRYPSARLTEFVTGCAAPVGRGRLTGWVCFTMPSQRSRSQNAPEQRKSPPRRRAEVRGSGPHANAARPQDAMDPVNCSLPGWNQQPDQHPMEAVKKVATGSTLPPDVRKPCGAATGETFMAFPPLPLHTRIVRYWSGRRLFQVTCFPLDALRPAPNLDPSIGRYLPYA